MHEKLISAAIEYDRGDAKRIQHFIKVYQFAALIGSEEGLSDTEMKALSAAAILHDIGIREGERLYCRCDGEIQERLGPDIAKQIMAAVGGYEDVAERAAQLIGRHHTYTDIDGADCQILIEADFLVNLYEDGCGADAIKSAREKILRTKTGTSLLDTMFSLKEQ
ncbi:MAG: HD domain-containing protein [Eubacterium sp.]|nr:HD domain-containing protein [Eubacterium sp.]